MSDRKSNRLSGQVFRKEHAAAMCSRGTTIVISPNAAITSATHSGCSRCNAATNGDGAAASELAIGVVSLFSGSDAIPFSLCLRIPPTMSVVLSSATYPKLGEPENPTDLVGGTFIATYP